VSATPSSNGTAFKAVEYTLRYMKIEDISAVVSIDTQSFPSPWPPRSYAFEISNSDSSHMIVLEAIQPVHGWEKVWRRVRGRASSTTIVGYAGLWCISGEGHVSTIAVHPHWRGNGLGEVLLNGMLNRSLMLGAEYSVLEVRVGNTAAQALYVKYGYEIVGRRKNYYRDNNEDAYLMTLSPFDAAFIARLAALTEQLHHKVAYMDRLAETDPRPLKQIAH